MAQPYLVEPKKAPSLNIPPSSSTVDVRIIDSTAEIHAPPNLFFNPYIKGHDDLDIGSYCYLISHGSRHFLYDLGVRKNLDNFPPAIKKFTNKCEKVEKNVADILEEDVGGLGIKPKDIEAVILSHHHWDHTGDMTTFPKSTALIVGPGFKKAFEPFYPSGPESPMLEADVEGREFREINVFEEGHGLKIGKFSAFDFFSDGSLYILDTPGHSPGHISALARVTHDPASFMFLTGDACHHGGEIRPSEYLPLPSEIIPSPTPKFSACPGSLIQKLQPNGSAAQKFYTCHEWFPQDFKVCEESMRYIEEFDANDSVFVAMAHDKSLKGAIGFYPEKANNWQLRFSNVQARWTFLDDFRVAIEELAA